MIRPEGLVEHAVALAGSGPGRPGDVDLRRGVSACYYAAFHHLTQGAARHLVGSAPVTTQNAIRRAWSHGEIAAAARMVVEWSQTLHTDRRRDRDQAAAGPLLDLAAGDASLVTALRLLVQLQERRHAADYDHDVSFDKVMLLDAIDDAERSMELLDGCATPAREALFAILTVRRTDFAARR